MATIQQSQVPEADTRKDKAPKRDLPFYTGIPTAISGGQWLVVVAACAVAFAELALLPNLGGELVGHWIKAILFMAIPLVALAWAAPTGWTAIFRKVRVRDVFAMIGFGLISVTVTVMVASPLANAIGAESNPANSLLENLSGAGKVSWFLSTIPQLIGEELITILPLLAILSVLVRRFRWSRNVALTVAWVGTAVIFGALHLPTYGWNILQCLILIGFARILLTLWYVLTKNLWVSAGAHIVNDWLMFSVPLVLGTAAFVF